jgi:hypothetical protein
MPSTWQLQRCADPASRTALLEITLLSLHFSHAGRSIYEALTIFGKD